MKIITRNLFDYLNAKLPCPLFLRRAPQRQSMPYAVLTPVSHIEIDRGAGESGANETNWQLDIYCVDDFTADDLASAVIAAVDVPQAGYALGAADVIYSVLTGVSGSADLIDQDGDEQYVRRMIEFTIQYN